MFISRTELIIVLQSISDLEKKLKKLDERLDRELGSRWGQKLNLTRTPSP